MGEVEGVTYYYTDTEKFEKMIENGEMLEYAVYGGNYYGTPKKAVTDMLECGKNVILEIEPQGALKVKAQMPEAVLIFIAPPSISELKKRLSDRAREDDAEIERRINAAKWEFSQAPKYNYVIVNDDLDTCVEDTLNIIKSANDKQQVIEKLLSEI